MKMCGKVVGARNGYVTTYMPKPFPVYKWFRNAYSSKPLEQTVTQNLFYADEEKKRFLIRFGKKLYRRTISSRTQNVCNS